MSMPFYVSPEQLMKDRADFARKGVARGRSVAVVRYADGVLFVSENPSAALHKISEIYDRIAFAAVGRYNEFENLRIAGVRLADMRGYSYDRRDVTGRGLANAYAQTLGTIFSAGGEKPYEIEIFVAEVGDAPSDDQIFRLTFDGQIVEEHDFAVMGGAAESVTKYLAERHAPGLARDQAITLAAAALGQGETGHRDIDAGDLEVAVLDRARFQERKFRRVSGEALTEILHAQEAPDAQDAQDAPGAEPAAPAEPAAGPAGGPAASPAAEADPGSTASAPEDEPPVAP